MEIKINKNVLKNLAVRSRLYLLETAVSCGMDETQSQETAYFCFMKSVMQCYLDENRILMLAEQIFPHWETPNCLDCAKDHIMNLLRTKISHEIWTSQVQIVGWIHQ